MLRAARGHAMQESDATREAMKEKEEKGTEEAADAASDIDRVVRRIGIGIGMNSNGRRNLGGPGSSPPRCTSKCGKCTPCKPVHVPVPPGTPVTAEYYPEAWRCKCGNKLFMP